MAIHSLHKPLAEMAEPYDCYIQHVLFIMCAPTLFAMNLKALHALV
jgi:hypothetical protein